MGAKQEPGGRTEMPNSTSYFGDKMKTELSFSSHVCPALQPRAITENLQELGVASISKPDQKRYVMAAKQALS